MRHGLALALTLSTACSQGFSDGSGDGDDGTITGDGGTTGEVADALPDLDDDIDPSGCEELQGDVVAGAAAFFLGTFERGASASTWEGTEEYRLYANDAWVELGGSDCVAVWNVSASETSAGACGACELSLSVQAELDTGATTCDSAFTTGTETFSVSYDVDVSDDQDQTTWYFASSGTFLGEGYAVGAPLGEGEAAVSYLTDRTCQWFGSSE